MSFIFDKDKKTLSTQTIVLVQGENEATTLTFPLDIDEDDEYDCYLEFRLPKHRKYVVKLERTNDGYVYSVPSALTAVACELDMQLVLRQKDGDEIYKTLRCLGKLVVKKSIGGTEYAEDNLSDAQYDAIIDMFDDYATKAAVQTDIADFIKIAAVNTAVAAHNTADTAHADIRTALGQKTDSSAVSTAIGTHDASSSAHSDIRTAVTAAQTAATEAQTSAATAQTAATAAQSAADAAQADVDSLSEVALKTSAQTLDSSAKAQARNNVGACSLLDVYPVGALYLSVVSASPASLFGGSWEQLTTDAYLKIVTASAGDADGTASNHKIPLASLPSHSHVWANTDGAAGQSDNGNNFMAANQAIWGREWTYYKHSTSETGGGAAYYPYYVGVYVWKRVA